MPEIGQNSKEITGPSLSAALRPKVPGKLSDIHPSKALCSTMVSKITNDNRNRNKKLVYNSNIYINLYQMISSKNIFYTLIF